MKKLLSILLAVTLIFSVFMTGAFAASTATPTTASVFVNASSVSFEAYNINDNNYFKLRDLAKALSGTEKQFEVGWDAANNAISLTYGMAYTPIGDELSLSGNTGIRSAELSSHSVYLDGSKINLTAYNIDGYNYFKLRDVANEINFGVGWDGLTSAITIDTSVAYSSPTSQYLTVHFLNVGQGDSEFIVLPDGKSMLIDAGKADYADTVVNYIKNLGYSKIDYLIATHPHADHIGGMTKVIQSFDIGSLYMPNATTTTQTYIDLLTAIKNAGLTVTAAKAGVSILNSGSFSASIIAPSSDSYDNLNNYSAVVKITYNGNSFLFMGDAEELSENEITADVNADVLKVGHHGSASSTNQIFLIKVSPEYAVISVGNGNDYGHPAQITLDKLNNVGATIYKTDKDGTVVFMSDGTNITVDKSPTTNTGSGSTAPNVIISSVDKVAELVTINNNGTSDVNISGWVLVSVTGNQRLTLPSYTLKTGDKVTIASGGARGDLFWTDGYIWNNSKSDPAQLYDYQGRLVSTYAS